MADAIADEPDDSFIKNAVKFGIEKLTTYWTKILIEPSPSYYAIATILHPSLRLAWFKDHWRNHPIYYRKAETSMKKIFKAYFDTEDEQEEVIETPPTRRKVPGGNIHEEKFRRTMSVDVSILIGDRGYKKARRANKLKLYYGAFREDLLKEDELMDKPLAWWLKEGKKDYPTLYRIALDFLSIPCTSCECERAFSGGRRTVTIDRNPLHGSTIEALQLQKNGLRNGVVVSELKDLINFLDNLPPPSIEQPTEPFEDLT